MHFDVLYSTDMLHSLSSICNNAVFVMMSLAIGVICVHVDCCCWRM